MLCRKIIYLSIALMLFSNGVAFSHAYEHDYDEEHEESEICNILFSASDAIVIILFINMPMAPQ